jgi:histidine phosphotransfer protein HptB
MIDWDRIEELRTEVGAEDFCDVVDIFLEEVDEVIGRLRQDGTDKLEENLHFLKGSALNLGFDAFADLCQAGETAAREGRAESVAIDPILESYATCRAAFLSGVARLGCDRGLSSVA